MCSKAVLFQRNGSTQVTLVEGPGASSDTARPKAFVKQRYSVIKRHGDVMDALWQMGRARQRRTLQTDDDGRRQQAWRTSALTRCWNHPLDERNLGRAARQRQAEGLTQSRKRMRKAMSTCRFEIVPVRCEFLHYMQLASLNCDELCYVGPRLPDRASPI
jgi:hypothetical protein